MSHYYDKNGNPCHQVVGKNGELRDTIITDARKLGLVPSVSTVKELGVGYGLLEWMHNLLLDTAADNPYHPDELGLKEWKAAIFKQYRIVKEQPQKRGTEIHNALEDYYKTGIICKKDERFIVPVIETLEKEFPGVKWEAETSFSNYDIGFGGCVDLHSKGVWYWEEKVVDGFSRLYKKWIQHPIVLDFKTKDKPELTKSMQYDDHKMQLSAYQVGLELDEYATKRYNMFISVNEATPGKSLIVEAKEFDKFWNMFYSLVNYWQIRNNYIPKEAL